MVGLSIKGLAASEKMTVGKSTERKKKFNFQILKKNYMPLKLC